METKHPLVTLAEALAAHQGVGHYAISMRIAGKGDFFKRLMRPIALPLIAQATSCSVETARDLLDSTHGRHFADEVANQLARRLTLDTAIRAAIDVFQDWRIDRRVTREYGIPAGLPYLTGWAHHFEILGEAG